MTSFTVRSWLSLMMFLHLLGSVMATINITYPTEGTVYTQGGPYLVQWLWSSDDPANITIYLETFEGSTIANELRGITWATSDGSVTISMSELPPKGNSWKWAFYDTSKTLQLGLNEIAESPQFFINGSALPSTTSSGGSSPTNPSSTTQTSHASKKLSSGAAAAIGVVVTLLVIICLLAGLWFYRRSKRTPNRHAYDSGVTVPQTDTNPQSHSKPEAELAHEPYTAELTSNSRYEMAGQMAPNGH